MWRFWDMRGRCPVLAVLCRIVAVVGYFDQSRDSSDYLNCYVIALRGDVIMTSYTRSPNLDEHNHRHHDAISCHPAQGPNLSSAVEFMWGCRECQRAVPLTCSTPTQPALFIETSNHARTSAANPRRPNTNIARIYHRLYLTGGW
jgi:hypothetical protein